MNLTTGSDLQRFGEVMGFLMTGGIMIATIAYLWKRWRKTEGAKAAVMLFALVFLYPILAGGSLEKIWLGYLATLLLSAPIASRMFVNYAHQMPAGQRHEFYHIPKGEQVCPSLQRHGISKGEQVCPSCYSRFAAGVFLAVSLVMEPSCSALMAASPPGPADARIGLIGTASQQPAERSPDPLGQGQLGQGQRDQRERRYRPPFASPTVA